MNVDYCQICGNIGCLCYLEFKEECVCGETSSRNCPVHQNSHKTYCKDCGTETKRGKGSARCPSCWEDRCGYSTDNEE